MKHVYKVYLPHKVSMNDFYESKMHWRKRKQIVDEYHMAVFIDTRNKPVADSYPVHIEFVYYWTSNALDTSNCPTKLIEDGLIHAGIIKDDNPKHVARTSNESRLLKKSEKEANHVIITITSHL